ncbi:MAG: LapA family protein [candidate division Zixibacteria bacterium]|nr:LapA family protein [candidate division Zixibacteria bacterium]
MWAVRALLVLVLLLVVVAFAYNNFGPEQKVDVKLEPLLPNYLGVPLVTVVFWSFAAGAILSMFLFVSVYIKQSVDQYAAKKRIRSLENEVAILRNRPIEESAELLKGADRRNEEQESPFSGGNQS